MIGLRASEVAAMVGGRLEGRDVALHDVGADSRTLGPQSLFVALRGERDGHDWLAAAKEAGAAAALVERVVEDAPEGLSLIVVDDTWQAIARLAGMVRARIDPKVIAVTGSVGKTTTKDLIAAACSTRKRTVAAKGSFNNELGVPLTMLSLQRDTEVLVVEIGARGPGHIASLTPHVRPDVAVVTVVGGGAHLEQFGSVDAVAEAKAELVAGLRGAGVAVLNLDDERVASMSPAAPGLMAGFSAQGKEHAAYYATDITLDDQARPSFVAHTPRGEVSVTLPLAGAHNVTNALAAIAAAAAVGVAPADAARGLAQAKVSPWRSRVLMARGRLVLDDAYNANPTSMLAALDALAAVKVEGRRWAVLGVMAELGAAHEEGHRQVGRRAGEVADVLIVVGADARPMAEAALEAEHAEVVHCGHVGQAIGLLATRIGDAVLVKASRSAGLERVVDALTGRRRP